jgi:hypothetical protein
MATSISSSPASAATACCAISATGTPPEGCASRRSRRRPACAATAWRSRRPSSTPIGTATSISSSRATSTIRSPRPSCFAASSRRDYCGPQAFRPQRDLFYLNRGDGTFVEEGEPRLGEHAPQPGLGVVAADFDGDGWVDLFVANDGQPNHLWQNLGSAGPDRGARFAEIALAAGVAVNRSGLPEAGMGIALGDADGDLVEDLLVTHLTGETNTFYRNRGGLFDDRSLVSGLGPPSRPWTSFGAVWLDPDRMAISTWRRSPRRCGSPKRAGCRRIR